MANPPPRRRRADAQRSIDAILDASRTLLGQRPDASMEEIATAASVTRQTVYSHFASREALLSALVAAAGVETVSAFKAADLDALAPPEALSRYLDIGWQLIRSYPYLLGVALSRTPPGHAPTHEEGSAVLEHLIERGQQTGDFDRAQPADWLASAVIALIQTAAEQVLAGRLRAEDALTILRPGVLRLCGAVTSAPRRPV
ncbi:TetR/AcrR family transcriptional regulator [Cryptosporangium sp. NPDC048952]|uniref:TetR/AcrR family transcriptional regulator n=1 Tax=Cryptosporangium sp. NPDC048952 TaxID=3363961 RepID=UPI00372265CB